MSTRIKSANLGFSRMGADRQLKTYVENYWNGKINQQTLTQNYHAIMSSHWTIQKSYELDIIPSHDFSLYDHVLDHVELFGVIPSRYQIMRQSYLDSIKTCDPANIPYDYHTYFAMARGAQTTGDDQIKIDVSALQMKKWFDTNYHFSVPEFQSHQVFTLSPYIKPLHDWLYAKQQGITTRPVILGPVSFLLLGKWSKDESTTCQHDATDGISLLQLLPSLLSVYQQLFTILHKAGVTHVQLDEPMLCMDDASHEHVLDAYKQVYEVLNYEKMGIHVTIATYFGYMTLPVLSTILSLPINGLHVDIVRGGVDYLKQIVDIISHTSHKPVIPFELSLGVIDGRNIWIADLTTLHTTITQHVIQPLSNKTCQLIIAPSCSLLHVPYSLEKEKQMNEMIKSWLSFGLEKLSEIRILVLLLSCSIPSIISTLLSSNQHAINTRRTSPLIHRSDIQQHIHTIETDTTRSYYQRKSKFETRYQLQQERFKLPLLPTTTIGSFPQTADVRRARAQFRSGTLSSSDYLHLIHDWTHDCITQQDTWGLDVLVHGEFERTDMVEFFANYMTGYVMTEYGWVQSYGSRCVKPPILYGDISRLSPMTVDLSVYAQSLTSKPVKGMLTGPVTCLQWSFVREDIPRKQTCQQLAWAIRQEVQDLESAGIHMIQIDEPALREGLPLRHVDRVQYVSWSVDCFLLSSCGVLDTTQIHTHMCYSDFKHIMNEIIRMDADVITIEHARSDEALLDSFASHITIHEDGTTTKGYPACIGPGIYDIHTPRIPSQDEIISRIQRLIKHLPIHHIWINPDCGLKTRTPQQVKQALMNMVEATKVMRNMIQK